MLVPTGSSTPVPAPSSSPQTITLNPAARGANWGIVAFFSLLAIAAITIWRIHSSQPTEINAVKTVWSAIILAILISLLTDLDKGLGAAFGGSVVFFLLLKQSAALKAATAAVNPTDVNPATNPKAQGPVAPNGTSQTPSTPAPGSLFTVPKVSVD
jgi:hypothetical protein